MKAHLTRFALTFAAAAILILAAAAPAAAATQTFRDQIPFTFFVPCANGGLGEDVNGLLKVHVVVGTTEDEAGGTHFHAQIRLQGVGIGSVTDDSYQLHGDFPEVIIPNHENINAGGSDNFMLDLHFQAIGMGDAANWSGEFRIQGTTNANGVVTVDRSFITETCTPEPV